jgi:GNAT superfamily N-acetyltransferase
MSRLQIKRIQTERQRKAMLDLHRVCLPADKLVTVDSKSCAFGVYDSGDLVAFSVVRPSRGYQETVYLARAGVHPDYRGRGLQNQLIRKREEWAKRKGYKYAITDTNNESVASMRSLIATGYRPFWPQLSKPWALKSSVYWIKKL